MEQCKGMYPTSVEIAKSGGIVDSRQFSRVMSALVVDVLTKQVHPSVANAACNAAGKQLKVVEMRYRFAGGKAENLDLIG